MPGLERRDGMRLRTDTLPNQMVFGRGSKPDPGETSSTDVLRVAAAADLHCLPKTAAHTRKAFKAIAADADLILLAGGLTSHGQPNQAEVLADAVRDIDLPFFACVGTHDMPYEPL